MNDTHYVNLTSNGPPETVLPPENENSIHALNDALKETSDSSRREAISEVAARWPKNLLVWAYLGDLGRDAIESYAAYRVGYHRGLDRLRQSGWKGSGLVLWNRDENLGFLRSLEGLARTAKAIGETDEAERCSLFSKQLDPSYKDN